MDVCICMYSEVTRSDSRRGRDNLSTTQAAPGNTTATDATGAAPSSPNPGAAAQLQQYKQRLQLMNQQLRAGQQQLKELQKNPSQAQKVCRYDIMWCTMYSNILMWMRFYT